MSLFLFRLERERELKRGEREYEDTLLNLGFLGTDGEVGFKKCGVALIMKKLMVIM